MGDSSDGRRELLSRRLFELKRFDSADFFQPEGSAGLEAYASSAKHEMRRGIETKQREHEKDKIGVSPVLHKNPRPDEKCSFLERHARNAENIAKAAAEEGEDEAAAAESSRDADGPLESPRVAANKTSLVARRFLDKRSARKRWDSGDYNVYLKGGLASPAKPDLDVMSVSSADQSDGYCSQETKQEEVPSLRELVISGENSFGKAASPNAHGSRRGTGKEKSTALDMGSPNSCPATPSVGPPPIAPRPNSDKKSNPTHDAAKSHLMRHGKKNRRFDSADYFLGLSPPSSECDNSPIPVSPRANHGKTPLGVNSIGIRDLRKVDRAKQLEDDLNFLDCL